MMPDVPRAEQVREAGKRYRQRKRIKNPMMSPISRGAPGVRTHCPNGHAYAGDNLRFTPDGRRKCRACTLEYGRQQRARGLPPLYHTWKAMRQRCENVRHHHYRWYGAIGVKVCERWRKFENFVADMGDRPPGMSLDRIDPVGDYEPSNCRWATALEQRHNRRPNAHP